MGCIGTMDWFKIGKGVHQSCILAPCLFNLYAEYIMRNARLDEAQAGIKIARRNINHLRYAHPYGRKQRGNKEPVNEGERREWKSWLKTQHSKNKDYGIQSHHFKIDGETMETVREFIFLGSKITADGDCSHEIKSWLLLGWKAITNLHSIWRSRD